MAELTRESCAAGIIMQPSEKDLANPEVRRYLDRYMRGKDLGYWHSGDSNRNRISPLRSFDQEAMKGRIRELLQGPLSRGG
jgi:4-hydroxyphenylacetate 3-hydroxylase-like protein